MIALNLLDIHHIQDGAHNVRAARERTDAHCILRVDGLTLRMALMKGNKCNMLMLLGRWPLHIKHRVYVCVFHSLLI